MEEAQHRHRLSLTRELLARTRDPVVNPLDIDFRPFRGESYEAAWQKFSNLAKRGKLHPDWVLYVHLPFCAKVCSYCLLSSVRAPEKSLRDAYLNALIEQAKRFGAYLEGLAPRALHVGGGTPTLLSASDLDRLFAALGTAFPRTEDVPTGVEAYPSTATPDKMAVLAAHGVGRISLGVESLTPEVLRRANRADQTLERVARAIDVARAAGITRVNVDVLAGLPGETEDSFKQGLRELLQLDFDALSLNRYIAENSPLASFGYTPSNDDTRAADRMLVEGDRLIRELKPPNLPTEPVKAPGFGTQYVWFQRGRARPYFQQDMIGATSVLALGYGGMAHLHGGGYATNQGSLQDYVETLTRGEPLPMLLSPSPMTFEMAFYFGDHATRGELRATEFRSIFGREADAVFGPELSFLCRQGLLERTHDGWAKPENRTFSVAHLITFLRHDSTALEAHLSALEQPSENPSSSASTPVAVNFHHRSPAHAEALVKQGIRRLEWQPASELPENLEAEVVAAMAWCGSDLELCVRFSVNGTPADIERCEAAIRGGAQRFVLEMLSAEADAAERMWRVFAGRQLAVEVIKHGESPLSQYDAVEAELPPSLLWCRIAMTAAAATRRQRDPGLVRL
ncbi:MAG: radical SAM protein [Polyangiaceae bacterium]|nr:radical SAM protein [Polyangiaceae bacterium]